MSFPDYLTKGQVVDFEIEIEDKRPKFMSRVVEVDETNLVITIEEPDFSSEGITEGTKGIIWGKKRGLQYSLYVEVAAMQDNITVSLKHLPSRTHLRVDAFIKMTWKTISESDFLAKKKKYVLNMAPDSEEYLRAPQRFLGDDHDATSNIPPEIISEMHSIHRKLDFIIKILGQQDADNIFNIEPIEVNLSGSGLRFKTTDELPEDTYLDIELVLPISSGIIIGLIGQVVRTLPTTDGPQEKEIALKFAAVNEDDRECIIRYVFKRQRELLRAEENE